RLGELQAGRDRLATLFPASAAEIAQLVPEAEVKQGMGVITSALGEQALLDAIAATAREVAAVDSLRAWQDAAERIGTAASTHAAALGGKTSGAAASALA